MAKIGSGKEYLLGCCSDKYVGEPNGDLELGNQGHEQMKKSLKAAFGQHD